MAHATITRRHFRDCYELLTPMLFHSLLIMLLPGCTLVLASPRVLIISISGEDERHTDASLTMAAVAFRLNSPSYFPAYTYREKCWT